MPDQDRVPSIINILEVIVLFVVGILGNKIAEILKIPVNSLFVLTAVLLVVLTVIAYVRSGSRARIQAPNIKKHVPKTMMGIFPIGILTGFVVGAIVISLRLESLDVIIPWVSIIFGYEFIGVLIGTVFCVAFALLIDSYLSASFLFGYSLAFPTAILFIAPTDSNLAWMTYLGHMAYGTLLIFILIKVVPACKRGLIHLKEIVTAERIE